jgi:hypothetical protein
MHFLFIFKGNFDYLKTWKIKKYKNKIFFLFIIVNKMDRFSNKSNDKLY